MDLVKEAIFLGFSGAAVMDTTQLVFVPEYRMFCEEKFMRLLQCKSGLSAGERDRGRDETVCIAV